MTPSPLLQFVPVTLRADVDEAAFLAACDAFQADFVAGQVGVRQRLVLRGTDGTYADLVVFADPAAADQVMQAEQSSAACHAFMALMAPPTDHAEGPAIASYTVLRAY